MKNNPQNTNNTVRNCCQAARARQSICNATNQFPKLFLMLKAVVAFATILYFSEFILYPLLASACFFVIWHISDFIVNLFVGKPFIRFTLYEGFAGLFFLFYTILVCFLHFRIKRPKIILTTLVFFLLSFFVSIGDSFVIFKSGDNGDYPWNEVLGGLQELFTWHIFQIDILLAFEFWLLLDLLLIALLVKYYKKIFNAR